MGTAGVTTGSLTGEGTQAKPVDNVGTLLGNITVIDPGTGLPEDSFTANDQGEVFIGIQGAPGQTEVAINIGGQDYLVDLAPVQGNAQVILDYVNFNDPATGYQSVATVTPFFGGLTPTNPVTWTVESIRNPTHPWWLRSGTSYAGLTWGLAADPAAYTGAGNWPDTVRGTAPTGPVAQITDVVGSRSVTLKAETTIDGVMYSETMDVTFGPGPLSVFRTAPAVGVKWARSAGNAATAADPGNDGNMLALNGNSGADFPAAVQICGGSINVSAITSTTTVPGSHNAGFDYTPGSGWEQDIKWASLSRALNSKLPHYDQLIAVSMYSTTHNPGIPRKGAALAAGWPDDGLGAGVYRYWSNPINMMGAGYFLATNVGLRVGAEETSNRVNYNIPNVVCVF
jgi:hypothetical protein